MMRPKIEDHLPTQEYFIDKVAENDVLPALKNNHQEVLSFIKSIPKEKADYKYAENKWTIKQVINHIIDCERIYSYRVLRFSRGDAQTLLSFNPDMYAQNANVSRLDLNFLKVEFDIVRKSTIIQFEQLSDKELLLRGSIPAGELNVLAMGFFICGHAKHHINFIKEKYLNQQ